MFELTKSQLKKADKWMKKTEKSSPNLSSEPRFTYCFTPNGIGVSIVLIDIVTNTKIELTDYTTW